MKVSKTNTVAELVNQDFRAANILRKYGIDFCCGGNQSILQACEQNNLSYSELENDLLGIETSTDQDQDFATWELDRLARYIVDVHHNYVRENIPFILAYAEKVARVHGERHPENIEINRLFSTLANELYSHMEKEESILFPFIEALSARESNSSLSSMCFGSIEHPIRVMRMDHDEAGDILKSINHLTNNYTPPSMACTTYRVLYAKLEEFENDLHMHIHLENNILFPKSIKLAQAISN